MLCGVLFFISCKNDNEQIGTPPILVSSQPADNAANVDLLSGMLSITLTFDQNISFTSSNYTKIVLNDAKVLSATAGANTLTIQANELKTGTAYKLIIPEGSVKGTGSAYNQEISISFTTKGLLTTETPCDKQATENAKKLYTFLRSIYGEKTLSSTMVNVNWNYTEANNVYKLTGKYPAMNCYDFIQIPYSPVNWIDYSNITPVTEWANAGGIVALMWHFIVPTQEGSTNYTYEPTKTTFHGTNIFTSGTWENKFFYQQMDKVCESILKIQDAGIPVIWRPFHEAAGNYYSGGSAWFWWGYDGPENYVKLWKLMFDYFQKKGIHNLIWVWTTQNTGDNAYYPGSDYVDLIGCDLYGKDAAETYKAWSTMRSTYPQKMAALSECGNYVNGRTILKTQALISDQWNQGCRWLYFMPWYDYDYNAGNAAVNVMCNNNFWTTAMSSGYVLTRDDVKYLSLHK